MLIKIIKLVLRFHLSCVPSRLSYLCTILILQFGALTPLEKRLAKRLVQPLTNLINTTTAMSLLYECIQVNTTLRQIPVLVQ